LLQKRLLQERRAAIDRYLLHAGRSAVNPPLLQSIDGTDEPGSTVSQKTAPHSKRAVSIIQQLTTKVVAHHAIYYYKQNTNGS